MDVVGLSYEWDCDLHIALDTDGALTSAVNGHSSHAAPNAVYRHVVRALLLRGR